MFEERDYASENDPKSHGDVKDSRQGTDNMKDRWFVGLGSLGLGQIPVRIACSCATASLGLRGTRSSVAILTAFLTRLTPKARAQRLGPTAWW